MRGKSCGLRPWWQPLRTARGPAWLIPTGKPTRWTREPQTQLCPNQEQIVTLCWKCALYQVLDLNHSSLRGNSILGLQMGKLRIGEVKEPAH